jgi:small-conductance mechanosensitive channel
MSEKGDFIEFFRLAGQTSATLISLMKIRLSLLGLALFLAPFSGQAADASTRLNVDLSYLTRLYQAQLRVGEGKSPSIERQILSERSKIRGDADDQVNDLINAMSRESTGSTLNVNQAISEQQNLVSALETRKESIVVDLSLLTTERQEIYGSGSGSVTADTARITQTLPELLARKASLEEQSQSFDFFLRLENDRLQKLQWQQRVQQFSLLITIAKYVLLALIVILLERFIRLRFLLRIQNASTRYIVMKAFTAFVYITAILWAITRLTGEYPQILTSLAIFGAGVAFSIQDVLKDIVGSLIIIQRRLFTLGQRVTIGAYTGDVVDIGLLRTTLVEVNNTLNPDIARMGQILTLPNSMVLTQPVVNYHTTSDYVDGQFSMTVTYDSDWKRAKEIMEELLHEETQTAIDRARLQQLGRMRQFYSSHEPQGARVFMEPGAIGIVLTLQFLVPIGQRRTFITRLSGLIFEKFSKEKNIKLALDAGHSTELKI